MLGVLLLFQALTIAVAGPPTSPEYLPLRVAHAAGDFTREGLEVSLRTTRSEAQTAEALADGEADLAATSLEALVRHGTRRGAAIPRLVFALTAAPPVALLVNPTYAGSVRTVADLAGGRVAISGPGSPERAWLHGALSRAELGPTAVTVIALGSRGVGEAMARGEVRAALVGEPAATRLVSERGAIVLADFRSPTAAQRNLGTPTVNAALFMRPDRPVADTELAAVARALLAARHRLATAPAAAIAIALPANLVRRHEEIEEQIGALRDVYLPEGLVPPEAITATVAMIRSVSPLPRWLALPRPERFLHLGPVRPGLSPRPHRDPNLDSGSPRRVRRSSPRPVTRRGAGRRHGGGTASRREAARQHSNTSR